MSTGGRCNSGLERMNEVIINNSDSDRCGQSTLEASAAWLIIVASVDAILMKPTAESRRRGATTEEWRPLSGAGPEDHLTGRRSRARTAAAHQGWFLARQGDRTLPGRPTETVHGRIAAAVTAGRPFVVIKVVVHGLLEVVRRIVRLLDVSAADETAAGQGWSSSQRRAPALKLPVPH